MAECITGLISLSAIKVSTIIIFSVRTHGRLRAIVIFIVRTGSQWPYWNKAL